MTEDRRLMVDEAESISQHESLKNEMRNSVQKDIVRQADYRSRNDEAQIAAAGEDLRRNAVDEVVSEEKKLSRSRIAVRVSQCVDYLFYLIYGIIGLEIILNLAGANRSNVFRQIIDSLSTPLLSPFENLRGDPGWGRFQFRLSYIVALVVYVLLHLAINGLLRLIAQRKTVI